MALSLRREATVAVEEYGDIVVCRDDDMNVTLEVTNENGTQLAFFELTVEECGDLQAALQYVTN